MLGVLPGIIGSIQAVEAIKMLLGLGDPLVGRLLAYDALEESFRTFKVRRDPALPGVRARRRRDRHRRVRRPLHAAHPLSSGRPAGGASAGPRVPIDLLTLAPLPGCARDRPPGPTGHPGRVPGVGLRRLRPRQLRLLRQFAARGRQRLARRHGHGPAHRPVGWRQDSGSSCTDVTATHGASVASVDSESSPVPPSTVQTLSADSR